MAQAVDEDDSAIQGAVVLPTITEHDAWDIDQEEKARQIAEEDLNRKKKQVS